MGLSLDDIFQKTVSKKKFYGNAKIPRKKEKDPTLAAMNRFFEACVDVPQPNFINFSDNTLFFVEELINQGNSEAIK